MNTWFGLFIGGDLEYVIKWNGSYLPTVFDFNVAIHSWREYEILEVIITPERI